MGTNELYLKTLFCCSACDGEIAPEEVLLVKQISINDSTFEGLDVENTLNSYVDRINEQGSIFLKDYLSEVANSTLSDAEQIKLIEFAIKMIEADNQILYSEVKFFKKIRNRLSVSDDCILAKLQDSEDYLLPDISSEDKDLEEVGNFEQISFSEVQ
ncbi:MAG: TerB family tellurite resistance protein [Bacteroides sp.]|nr:TerB family tellurite resistance protein [Bacteroides sp.]